MFVRRLGFVAALVLAPPAAAEQVGEIGTDWTGNDIVIEAIADPQVEGNTCHVTYFGRGMIDRLRQGNWFEDPSNSSIACRHRVYDQANDTLIYVSFSRQIQEASAKMAVSTIPLFGTEVTWVNGKPE